MPNFRPLVAVVILILASARHGRSQDSALDLLLDQHKTTIETIALSREVEVAKLNPKYEAALNRIKKKHQADEDFDATIAVGHELKTFADKEASVSGASPGKPSSALIKAKSTYQKSLANIQRAIDAKLVAETEDTLSKLKELAANYAATDKIDDAIATDGARKALLAEANYSAAKQRLQNAPDPAVADRSLVAGLPRQGLVAHYPFEGNLTNGQQGGTKLLHQGKKNYANGTVGRALSIENGHGIEPNYIDFPLPKAGKSSFSISFCFKPDMGAHSQRTLMGIGPGNRTDVFNFAFQREGGDHAHMVIRRQPDDWEGKSGGSERPEPEWCHILITVEPNLVNYYKNGRIMFAYPTSKPLDTAGMNAHIPMVYEMHRTEDGNKKLAPICRLDCLIDELTIYDRVLRSNEIRDLVKLYDVEE